MDADTLASAALLQKMKAQYGPQKMMSALMSFMNSDNSPPSCVTIPGLSDIPATTNASTSVSHTTTSGSRGYYSSGSVTANYSSSPQPPEQTPTRVPVQEQYNFPPPVSYQNQQIQHYPTGYLQQPHSSLNTFYPQPAQPQNYNLHQK